MRTPRGKSVAFDIPKSGDTSPEQTRQHAQRDGSAEEEFDDRTRDAHDADLSSADGERKRRRHRRHRSHDTTESGDEERPTTGAEGFTAGSSADNQRNTSRSRRDSRDQSDSDSTVDLPPRFDEQGQRMPSEHEDPLAGRIQDILAGRGTAGSLFRRITGDLLGGGEERDGGRRRR